ncbi:MAG: STAS/SEC14 domain-containing protein [Porticoccaceae bacterium]
MVNAGRHGISIGIELVESEIFIGLKVVGRLSHEDYQVFTPVLESALAAVDDPNVRMLVDLTDFGGWEPRAAWDDLKIGLRHGRQFRKIAIYGDHHWRDMLTNIGSWFVSGEIKSFATVDEAMNWLNLRD